MANEIGVAYVTVMPSASGFFKAMNADAYKSGSSSAKGFADKFGSVLGGGAIAGVASSVFSKVSNTISSSLNGAFARADILNSFPKTMQTLGFSAEEAGASIGSIKDHLNGLPSSTQAVASFVKQLTASTGNLSKATSLGLAFNDMMLAAGASTSDAENAMTQFNQMLAAGKVDQQAWNSVVAAAPGQLNQLAKAMIGPTANQKDLYEALKNGTITMDQFQDGIIKLGTEGAEGMTSFAEAAKAGSVGIGTSLENVQNRVVAAVANIVSHIGVDKIAGAIDSFSGQFSKISNAAISAIDIAADAFNRLAPSINTGWIDLVAERFQRVMDAGSALGDALMSLGEEFISSGAAAQIINDAMWALNVVVGAITTPLQLIGQYVGAFVQQCADNGAVQTFADIMSDLSLIAGSVFGLIMDTAQAIFDWAGGADGAASAADGFKGALDALHSILEPISFWISDLTENFDQIAPAVMAAVAGFTAFKTASAIASTIQAAQTALDAFKKAQEASTLSQAALNAVMNANPFVLAATAIAAVTAGLAYFFTQTELGQELWATFSSFFTDTVSAIGSIFNTVWGGITTFFTETIPNAIQGFLDFFASLPETAASIAQGFVDNIVNFFMHLPENIGMILGLVIGAIAGFAASAIQWAIDAGSQFVSNIINFVMNLPQNFMTWLTSTLTNIGSWVSNVIDNGARAGSQFLANVVDNIRQLPGRIWTWLSNAISKLGSFVSDTIAKAGEAGRGFLNGIKDGFNQAVDFVKSIPQKLLDALGNVGSFLLDAGKSLLKGFTDGIMSGFNAAKDAVSNGIQAVRDFFPFSPAKVGPLSGRGYTTFSGAHMMQDWASSIAKASPEAIKSALDAATDVSKALEVSPTLNVSAQKYSFAPEEYGSDRAQINQTLVFNEPWKSPDEVARAMRLESRYGIAKSW